MLDRSNVGSRGLHHLKRSLRVLDQRRCLCAYVCVCLCLYVCMHIYTYIYIYNNNNNKNNINNKNLNNNTCLIDLRNPTLRSRRAAFAMYGS